MTIDSRNLVGAGLALAIVGLAAWGSTVLLNPPQERKGTVEVRPLLFSVEESQRLSSAEQPK
jgi:hypothetical protein